jgi:hypothetical protein
MARAGVEAAAGGAGAFVGPLWAQALRGSAAASAVAAVARSQQRLLVARGAVCRR